MRLKFFHKTPELKKKEENSKFHNCSFYIRNFSIIHSISKSSNFLNIFESFPQYSQKPHLERYFRRFLEICEIITKFAGILGKINFVEFQE